MFSLSELMKLDSINRAGRPSLTKSQCLALRFLSLKNHDLNKLQLCYKWVFCYSNRKGNRMGSQSAILSADL